jgi:hypothetical protein
MDAKEQFEKFCKSSQDDKDLVEACNGDACSKCIMAFEVGYHSRDEEVKKYKEQKNSTVRRAVQQNRELKQIITKLQHELEIQRNNNVLSEQLRVQEVEKLKDLLETVIILNNVNATIQTSNGTYKLIEKINEVLK